MSHIVDSCLLTKLVGGLSKLHSADDAAVARMINYGGPWIEDAHDKQELTGRAFGL